MTRCACCRTALVVGPLKTSLGEVMPYEGICRGCLRFVRTCLRHELRRARRELRLAPHLAQVIALERAWELIKADVLSRRFGGVAA